MKYFFKRDIGWMAGIILIFALFLLEGCSTISREKREESTKDTLGGRYYYFEDVRVPQELHYKQNKSFIYETPRFKAGVLYFTKWRLDPDSLIDFFLSSMEKDNWKLINSYKGKESILNFSKPDKSCMIKIIEKWWGNTEVEIRVGPTSEK